MNTDLHTEVRMIHTPSELDKAHLRQMDIRFDCIVRMHDFGAREVRTGLFETKSLPAQHFVLEMNLTLELVKHMEPYELGKCIKDAYGRLETYIEDYKKGASNRESVD